MQKHNTLKSFIDGFMDEYKKNQKKQKKKSAKEYGRQMYHSIDHIKNTFKESSVRLANTERTKPLSKPTDNRKSAQKYDEAQSYW